MTASHGFELFLFNESDDMADEPKIHIDSDWKAQAQAEREKLRESEQKKQAKPSAPGGQPSASGQGESVPAAEEQSAGAGEDEGEREMPPANFETLMQTLASNALLAMGAVPDPETGQRYAHMGLAKHHIDMLGVLQEKTQGNLSEEEEQTLSTTVTELRNAFVQLVEQARQMQMQGQGPEAAGAAGGAGPQPGPGMQGPGVQGPGMQGPGGPLRGETQ